MKIFHTAKSLAISAGGPPRSISQLCDELSRHNASVGIVTSIDSDDPIIELNPSIDLKEAKSYNPFIVGGCLKSPGFSKALHEVYSNQTIGLIHQHGIWLRSSHEVIQSAKNLKIPIVVAPRGMLEKWALEHKKMKKSLAWALYQKRDLERATAFHATALSEAESIRSLGFKQPIAIIPNGIQLPEVKNFEQKTKKSEKTALFLSRINPKKGLPMLLKAWKAVSPEGWGLIIAGNDDSNHLREVEAGITEHKLQEQVEIVGPLFGEAKEAAYRSADLFILPSYSENFGIVVAEALGYGVPVLTTTGCPWQELQIHDCGWWVEPTLQGITSGLGSALNTTHEQLFDMGMRGRSLVEKNYQWPGIAEKMIKFYEWLINGGKQPDFVV